MTHDSRPIDRRFRTSLLIFLLSLLIYNSNFRSISAGDTYPARYLPFAILRHHTIYLDPIETVAAQGRGAGAFWMLHRPDGHIISLYPITLPVLISPLYIPAAAYLHVRGWSDARVDDVAKIMEKASASLLAALAAALLYLLLRRRARHSVALLLTIAFAFGTTTWVVSSQALWQHGLAELLIIGALLFLTAPCTTPRTIAVALLVGLIACNRPPDVVLAAALGCYGLLWAGRRRAVLLTAVAALPMLLVLFYNLHTADNIGGGYGVIGKAKFFQHPLLPGIGGLLISPTKGLFLFSPFLLVAILIWRHLPRDREEQALTLAMIGGVVIQIVLYAKTDWRGGLSWGPRYMTDLLPLLFWMIVPVVAALRSVGRVLFVIAVGISIILEAIGAFTYTPSIDLPIYAADPNVSEHNMRAAWEWKNASFITSLQHGLAPMDLAVRVRGNLDGIESGGRITSEIAAGDEAFATGWALAGDATPAQVAVTIDGKRSSATTLFTDRPDVRASLHAQNPAGWRVPLDTAGLTPGKHRVAAVAWYSGKGEGHFLEERTLMVMGAAVSEIVAIDEEQTDLRENIRTAIARIREHQQPEGYWLTTFTKAPRFEAPHVEMNTFLTSTLIDLLAPLPATNGFHENLQRARQHLTAQIESNGLVRYHGLPNAPGIGTLGCAITPDTDDTALVWRVAPSSDRSRLNTALNAIERYRTRDGLYRSWLAPRDAYQCLDPGRDPNPADVAIQMNLLLLLAEAKPAEGHALCEALRPAIDDDRIWVYYAKTPLLPILRLPDLRRVGCELELPESRLRSEVPEQKIWVSAARLLTESTVSRDADPLLLRAMLREFARDDFALIRTNPPLLYHNDLTATVSRYYWSEDVGYALWLRLYDRYRLLSHRAG